MKEADTPGHTSSDPCVMSTVLRPAGWDSFQEADDIN